MHYKWVTAEIIMLLQKYEGFGNVYVLVKVCIVHITSHVYRIWYDNIQSVHILK